MDPVTMTLISLIPSLVQTGIGAGQGIIGMRMGREEQPMMDIPDSIRDLLSTSKNLAGQRKAPGSDIARDRVSSGVAAAMKHATNIQGGSGTGLAAMGNLFTAEQQALQDIDIQDQQFHQQNQMQLLDTLKHMGAWEDLQWMRNVKEPFDRNMQTAAAMKEGAIQNIFGGVSSGVGASLYGARYNELMKKLFPETPPDMSHVTRTTLPENTPIQEVLPEMTGLPANTQWRGFMQDRGLMFGDDRFTFPGMEQLPYSLFNQGGPFPQQSPPTHWREWLQGILPASVPKIPEFQSYNTLFK